MSDIWILCELYAKNHPVIFQKILQKNVIQLLDDITSGNCTQKYYQTYRIPLFTQRHSV